MNKALLLFITLMTAGCSTLDKVLENRVSCTLDGKMGVYSSFYGPLALGSKIAEADAAKMCNAPAPANTSRI